MPGGRKKKSASAKKNKAARRNNGAGPAAAGTPQKPIPLEEILGKAETAMETSDVNTALQLFTYASSVLRSRVHAPTTTGATAAPQQQQQQNDNIDQDKQTLSTVLGKMGELKASNGDVDGARCDFLDAIELLGGGTDSKMIMATAGDEEECNNNNVTAAQNCESRAGLQLYLGQLSSGTEALESFRVGVSEFEQAIGVLERVCSAADCGGGDMDMEGSGEMDSVNLKRYLVETRRQLCAAYCSIAELYLTDLCEEPDAESSCEAALKSALALDEAASANASAESGPPLPDALQTMANFRLSQSRVSEALECILKAYDRMKVGCEAMSALVGLGSDGSNGKGDADIEAKSRELVDVEAASSLPEYNFRCQTAKIMLECASLVENDSSGATKNQCAESAIQVLGGLLAENDEVIEVWYLLGCAFMACTPPNEESAHYYWENALTMLTRAKEGLEQQVDDDDDGYIENELEAIECQILEVKEKLGRGDEDDEDMEDS